MSNVVPFPAPDLRFEPEEHRYFLGDDELPSVTTVLKRAGLVNYDFCTEYARERGSVIHKAIHLELSGKGLDWSTLNEELHPPVSGALQFVEDMKAKTIATEERVHSTLYRYAGTLDWRGIIDGKLWIIDWKSFMTPTKATGWQTAGYADASTEMTGQRVSKRCAVHLAPDGRYKTELYESRADLQVFRAALIIANVRREVGLLS
jgi:hypothetical protein